MTINACVPVIPSLDLNKSLRFWVDGLGFTADQKMEQEGRLVGCMVHNEHLYFWLNQRAGDPIPEAYKGIGLYWTPANLAKTREHLKQL